MKWRRILYWFMVGFLGRIKPLMEAALWAFLISFGWHLGAAALENREAPARCEPAAPADDSDSSTG